MVRLIYVIIEDTFTATLIYYSEREVKNKCLIKFQSSTITCMAVSITSCPRGAAAEACGPVSFLLLLIRATCGIAVVTYK